MAITPGVTNFDKNKLYFYATASTENEKLLIGVMTNPQDESTFELVETIDAPVVKTLFEVSFPVNNLKPYIVFRHGLQNTSSSIRLDDVEWKDVTVAVKPNPAVIVYPLADATNVDVMNDVILSWSSGGGEPTGYKLSVGTSQAQITNIFEGDLGEATSNAVLNLNYNTKYYWKVTPYNAQGDAENVPIWSFTTMPNPTVSTFTWNEGFETVATHYHGKYNYMYPMGWSLENNNDAHLSWTTIANSASITTNAHTGTRAMHLFSGVAFLLSMDDWFFTPPLDLKADHKYEFSVWYKATVYEGATSEKMKIVVGTDNNSVAMTGDVLFNDEQITVEGYTKFTKQFVPTNDGINYIGFHGFSDPYQWILFIDDVSIKDLGVVGLDELETVECELYPNPATDEITLKMAEVSQNANYTITDVLGKQIQQNAISNNLERISLTEYQSGIYFITIENAGKIITKKFIKH